MRVAVASTRVSMLVARAAGADRQAVKAVEANRRVIEVAEADKLVTEVATVAYTEDFDFIRACPLLDLAEA